MSNEELSPQREMTLDEWVARLDPSHRVHKELKALKRDSDMLSALNGAGVDNWDGHQYAMESYLAEHPEENDEENKRFDVV